ncbi:phosphate signaling complex protein PhoU [Rhodococcus opacus]|uniref:Phosphate-specific transport system accessory protein PhoU n=1 Tax=Rhodococcus opacus (strain B4) TaxID=632772 RepID=C1BEB9_RHOOB|nr:phosphate signaling complex protein PhoU [Rhodococcus opacus]BAH56159.1 PhoU family protein [Rhodococcus opacus B4]
MRTKFHDQLDTLFDQLTTMCQLAGDAVTTATDALDAADLTHAEKVFAVTERIGALRGPCEDQAMALLALQAPVARDLRQVVTGVFLVSDLSRMGGLAEHIAESVRRRHPHPVAHGQTQHLLVQMGRLAGELATAAALVLQTRDPALALALDVTDNRLDDLHRDLLTVIQEPAWDGSTTEAVDATLLGRFYERFGDHCVEVGRRVIFLATGQQLPQ